MSDPRYFFPIMYATQERRLHPEWPEGFPWHLLTPHEEQAMQNHGQTLEVLASRGGLGPDEMYAVLTDQPWRALERPLVTAKFVDLLIEAAAANLLATVGTPTSPDRESIAAVAQAAVDFWHHGKQSARDRLCAIHQIAALRKLGWKAPHDPVTDKEVEEAYNAYERDPYHLDHEAMRDAIEAARKAKPE